MSETESDIWVLTDGRAGNEAQALGLAEALAHARPASISVKRISLKPWASAVPSVLAQHLPATRNGWPFKGLAEGGETLHWPWPDVLISAGRRSAPTAAAIRKLHDVTTIQLLDPQMSPGGFDSIVVPEHDGLTGANVISTIGALNRITPAKIEESAAGIDVSSLTRPMLAVLIGGPSKSATMTDADERRLLTALDTLSSGFGLMITTSRRTPESLVRALRDTIGQRAALWTSEADGPNPYPGMLGHADAALVTEDSINMASEAASSGLPVHVFPLTRVADKFRRFHEGLVARGASRRFTGQIEQWSYAPLAEAERVASDLIRRGVV